MRRIFASLDQEARSSDNIIADLRGNIHLLTRYIRPYRGKLVAALLVTTLVALSSLAGPYLMKMAIDDYIIPGNLQGLAVVAALMMASYSLFWWSSYWQTYLAGWVGQVIIARIRQDIFSRMQRLHMKFFVNRQTGELMSRVTHDVNTLTDLLSNGFINLISDVATLGVILVLMFYLHSGLTLVIFLLLPLMVLIFLFLGNKMRFAYQQVREKMASLNAGLEENISGIRTVKALSQEKTTQSRFNQLSASNVKANLQAVGIFSLFFPAMNFTRVLGEAVIFGYGGFLVIEGEMTLGILAAFLGYLRQFFRPVLDLSQVFNTYQQAAAALDRINQYMNLPVEKLTKEGTLTAANESGNLPGDVRGEIAFENVYFSYNEGEPYILRGINFKISPGEAVSLVGESGVGKSTLVKLLTRLYVPDEGKILLDGVDINEIPLHALRSWIGVFSQDVHLFNRSIADNIRYGNFEASHEQIQSAAKKAHIHDFITSLPHGYNSIVGQKGVKLSGGQRQLIALARLFLKDPCVLVLDEPTSNVDVHTEALIVEAIKTLMKNRTVLLISHRKSTISFTDKQLYIFE